MRIAIIGTRGIPNHYGGFEQFAEYFSVYLAEKAHEVYVYTSHNHPFQEREFKGVHLIHTQNPEDKIGKIGQFVYDLNCIWDSRKRNFDIILQLGYTSSSVWHRLLPKKSIIITNMDGLEWKRTKYSKKVQWFLKQAERWAALNSDYLVADSVGIQDYLKNKYQKDSTYIAYGAQVFETPQPAILETYQLEPFQYNMLIARMEPENNIETILEGVAQSKNKQPFLVIGNYQINAFGKKMFEKYASLPNIKFFGGLYNQMHLDQLRYFSNLYFHGHTVGGTNPSLLEAMASGALVIAHRNIFNQSILGDDAYYFSEASEVTHYFESVHKKEEASKINSNFEKINRDYNWDLINGKYLSLFEKVLGNNL
jgi:glycosyltransferase involved in cell wall biosynthesis